MAMRDGLRALSDHQEARFRAACRRVEADVGTALFVGAHEPR